MSGDDDNNAGESGDVNSTNSSDPKAASRYALQVALQTMKERCKHFQDRLSAVEEENLKLHLERLNYNVNESKSDTARLEEEVAQLTRQKSQLTQHIFMVAAENKQLWTRLSRLTEANQSLGSHLTKISETLISHPAGDVSKPSQSINIANVCDKESKESKDESLEEISLKLINNIMREKMDLEQQYDQMVELQTNNVSMENCEFTLKNSNGLEVEDIEPRETEDILQDIRRVAEKLKEEKEVLMQQQAGLKATVAVVSAIVRNGVPCSTCQKIKEDTNTVAIHQKSAFLQTRLDGLERQLKHVSGPPTSPMDNKVYHEPSDENSLFLDLDDRICPLCGKFYHKTTKFEEFNQHVLTHFPVEKEIECMAYKGVVEIKLSCNVFAILLSLLTFFFCQFWRKHDSGQFGENQKIIDKHMEDL